MTKGGDAGESEGKETFLETETTFQLAKCKSCKDCTYCGPTVMDDIYLHHQMEHTDTAAGGWERKNWQYTVFLLNCLCITEAIQQASKKDQLVE